MGRGSINQTYLVQFTDSATPNANALQDLHLSFLQTNGCLASEQKSSTKRHFPEEKMTQSCPFLFTVEIVLSQLEYPVVERLSPSSSQRKFPSLCWSVRPIQNGCVSKFVFRNVSSSLFDILTKLPPSMMHLLLPWS